MEISPILLAEMLFVAFLFGIQSGIVFDIGRTLRALFLGEIKSKKIQKLRNVKLPISKRDAEGKKRKGLEIFKFIIIFFCDFLWIIYSFSGLMKINYSYNNGGIRIFTVFGLLVGFALYYFTFSRLVIFFVELLSFFMRFVFLALFDIIFFPFFKIYNNLVKKLKKSCEKIRFRIEKKRKKVYNVSEVVCENVNNKSTSAKVKISVRKDQKKGCGKNEEN